MHSRFLKKLILPRTNTHTAFYLKFVQKLRINQRSNMVEFRSRESHRNSSSMKLCWLQRYRCSLNVEILSWPNNYLFQWRKIDLLTVLWWMVRQLHGYFKVFKTNVKHSVMLKREELGKSVFSAISRLILPWVYHYGLLIREKRYFSTVAFRNTLFRLSISTVYDLKRSRFNLYH